MDDELVAYVERRLGPCTTTRVSGLPERNIIRISDARGQAWFAKQVPSDDEWWAEATAYREWVPAFQDQAPRLCAADRDLRAILISAVPGRIRAGWGASLQHDAGSLLRRVHESRPSRPDPEPIGEVMVQRFKKRQPHLKRMFSRRELSLALGQVRALRELPTQQLVPCHCDYQPGNWIVDEDAVVRVIDFTTAEWHAPAFDMTAIALIRWWGRPDLREAFCEGYGRELDQTEIELLRRCSLIRSMAMVRRGRLHAQPGLEARGRERVADLLSGGHQFAATFSQT